MTRPRKRKPGMNHTVSLTEEEWAQIKAWAAERGMSASRFFVQSALTVDLPRKGGKARPLVLDAERPDPEKPA